MLLLTVAQAVALLILLARLLPGRTRRPPVEPREDGAPPGAVSVIVATLNEARRIGPCLEGLALQGAALREVIIVDSRSDDGTDAVVRAAATRDPRVRLVHDPPLPDGWVGKVWALQHGLSLASGEWVLGIDADTEPVPGLVGGAVAAARADGLDAVSFSPRFTDQSVAEQWLQPAMLVTLVYRVGPTGTATDPRRAMANGQCFLARREVLLAHGGYAPARRSFSDDVTLARHLASRGARVGFLDGSRLYAVRSYASAREMWREWGRSIDLRDATTPARQWGDVLFLTLVQALPLPLLVGLLMARPAGAIAQVALGANAALVAVRALLLLPLRHSYDRARWTFWLSQLADPLAVARVLISTVARRRRWRGREYGASVRG